MHLYLLCFVLFLLCFLHRFVYVYVLLVLSVLPPSDNSIAVNINDNNNLVKVKPFLCSTNHDREVAASVALTSESRREEWATWK
jgi:hypothetical protein